MGPLLAIVMIAAADHNFAFTYYNKSFAQFHQTLGRRYQTRTHTVELESDVYKIMNFYSNANLFIIAGHGEENNKIILCPSNINQDNYDYVYGERRYLDTTDYELSNYLPNGVDIFLFSCSSGASSNNLVDFIYDLNTNNRVIGSTAPFTAEGVILEWPFNVKIYSRLPSYVYLKNRYIDYETIEAFLESPLRDVTYTRQ